MACQVASLAIYNPSLGPTDETFADQLVFWHSRVAREARSAAKRTGVENVDVARRDQNERLRQIGLAQGLVNFARTFSGGKPVDGVETGRSRIVLWPPEDGWWILASVDLAKVTAEVQTDEYSSRGLSPPALLVQQLRNAHRIFSLHHGSSWTTLYGSLGRERFCTALDRFWSRFARTWDVMLHDNPAAELLGGIKLGGGGELGFGVGEEDMGSAERAVLQDLVHRTEGLIDVVVSRFGEAEASGKESLPWLGSGRQPSSADGVVFCGVGAISRIDVGKMSLWIQQIFTDGELAYGIRQDPHRERRKRRRDVPKPDPKVPRPIISPKAASVSEASSTWGVPETYMKYLSLGLGGGSSSGSSSAVTRDKSPLRSREGEQEQKKREAEGYFLLGYRGDLSSSSSTISESDKSHPEPTLLLRTIHLTHTLAVAVIYIRRPMIYTFLFSESHTPLLHTPNLYLTIHADLTAIHTGLVAHTAPREASLYKLTSEDGMVCTNWPSIPAGYSSREWTRAEAMGVYACALNNMTLSDSTSLTIRGWVIRKLEGEEGGGRREVIALVPPMAAATETGTGSRVNSDYASGLWASLTFRSGGKNLGTGKMVQETEYVLSADELARGDG